MTASLALTVVLIGAGLLLSLPLIPAIIELRRRSDAMPLIVVQDHAGEIRYFADSFRSFVGSIESVLQACLLSGQSEAGTMPDGTNYLALGSSELPKLPSGRQAYVTNARNRTIHANKETCEVLIAAAGNLQLPARVVFGRDIFAKGDIAGGADNEYRAILGDRDIHLAFGSTLQRWVHANGRFTAEAECRLFGRVSSDSSIQLATMCTFLRLNAPRVELGKIFNDAPEVDDSDLNGRSKALPTRGDAMAGVGLREDGIRKRLLHDGDYELRAGQIFNGNLIVRGRLHIGDGAKVQGSVKCEKDVLVEDNAEVTGSLIAEHKLTIGRNCSIHGPILSEREVFIQRGSRCGTRGLPTTVSAPLIFAEDGVVVFGTVWARELGSVVAG
jgi:cytoskeletal protein CcmA (bactofilin family)